MPQKLDEKQELILKRLAERVKTIRKDNGWTLEEAGNGGGKDRQSVHRLESGKYNPSLIYLIELCRGFKMDISELLKDIDNDTL